MEEKIHFTRPPKIGELQKVLARGVEKIFMSKSTKQRLSVKAKKIIKKAKATIVIENARGRAIELTPAKISEVVELHKDNRTFREIENIAGVSKSTAHYLIRYAERQKMKKGNKVVYL